MMICIRHQTEQLCKLLKTYCYSLCGSALCDLSDPGIDAMYSMWRHGLQCVLQFTKCFASHAVLQLASRRWVVETYTALLYVQKCWSSDSVLVRFVVSYDAASQVICSTYLLIITLCFKFAISKDICMQLFLNFLSSCLMQD